MRTKMFLWKIRDEYPERLLGSYDRSSSPDPSLFRQGQEVFNLGIPVVRFDCRSSDLAGIDDLASNAMAPIVSSRIQNVLRDKCPNDIQLIDVRIITSDGEVPGYQLVNAKYAVQATDRDASDYKLIPGTDFIMKFCKLTLRPDCLQKHQLARDSDYLSNLIVSTSLGEHLKALKPVDIGLYSPEDMTW